MKYALIASLLLVVGCAQNSFDAKKRLPPGATNVEVLVEAYPYSWFTFELTIKGEKKRFLYRCEFDSRGDLLTEITKEGSK